MRRKPAPFSTAGASIALRRESVAVNAANHLFERIQSGMWPKCLPGEHELCDMLHISRNSLRTALQILAKRNILRICKGRRTEILYTHALKHPTRGRVVHLLTPLEIHELGPFMHEWSLRLRQALAMKDIPFEIHTRRQLFLRHSPKDMQDYINSHADGLWVLQVATLKMQTWFMTNRIPCLLAGSPYPGINLPFVDVHARAAGRHAAGLLLAAGHRSIAVLTFNQRYAGDHEALEGIRELAAKRDESQQIRIEEIKYSAEPDYLFQKLGEAVKRKNPPTALVLCQEWSVCGVFSALNRLRMQVPDDLSLVCLQAGSFMDYVTPSLSHYRSAPQNYARKLFQLIQHHLDNSKRGTQSPWLIPTYVAGKSIAPPAPVPL